MAQDPLMADLAAYANEHDATLTTPHFVAWLLKNRPALARIAPADLEAMAHESLMKFAHIAEPPETKDDPPAE